MSNFVLPAQLSLNGNLSENWKKFKKQFNIYMCATSFNKESEERQVAILLNLIGPEAVELQDTFNLEEDDVKKINKVLEAFESYCNPKKNVLHARFLFYSRKQKEGEAFDSFLTDCKTLIQDCEFTDADEILRDKIVLDSNDRETVDSIIKLGEIKLKKATEKFRIAELIRKQTKQIHGMEVYEVKTKKKQEDMSGKGNFKKGKESSDKCSEKRPFKPCKYKFNVVCARCGNKHEKNKCPASGRQCNKCKKFNHYAKMCKSEQQSSNSIEIENNNSENSKDESYYCDNVNKANVNVVSWNEILIVENKEIEFKLDTGSDVNIIPLDAFKSIQDSVKKKITPSKSKIKIEAYGGSEIP